MRSILWVGIALVVCGGLGCSSGTCQPETDQAFCARLQKTCDLFAGFDNCGASRSVNCGSCAGLCQANVCQSAGTTGGASTSGSSSTSSAGTTGGPTGGSSGGSASAAATGTTSGATSGSASTGTTGGTSGGVDAGCTENSCPGHVDIFSSSFSLGQWTLHDDQTLDGLLDENIEVVIGFNPGGVISGTTSWDYLMSSMEVSVSGDTSQLIATAMAPGWETGANSVISLDTTTNAMDMIIRPGSQVGPNYSLEVVCSTDEVSGSDLVSSGCTNGSLTLRYYSSGSTLVDAITTAPTVSRIHVTDGG